MSPLQSHGSFTRTVYGVVRAVPAGKVTTYGAVAAMAGSPRAARGVGAALNALTGPDQNGEEVPWWRVVNRMGRLTIPAELGLRALQRSLLESEAVTFDASGGIHMDRHEWDPSDAEWEALQSDPGAVDGAEDTASHPARGATG